MYVTDKTMRQIYGTRLKDKTTRLDNLTEKGKTQIYETGLKDKTKRKEKKRQDLTVKV